MPVWRRKELCEKLNLSHGYITTYINRGKLIPSDEKKQYFDTENEINATFINKRLKKLEAQEQTESEPEQPPEPGTDPEPESEPEPTKETFPPPPKKSAEKANGHDPLQPPKNWNKQSIAIWKSRLDAEQVRERVEILKLQKQRQLGNHLPVEEVERVIRSLIKNYTDEFKQVAENIVSKFSAIAKISPEMQAKMKEELIKEINLAGKRASDETKNDLKNVVEETKEARGKGESKINVRHDST